MKKRKILFTDLDATLLKDDGTITNKNREAIAALLSQGNYIVIATGRPVESGRKIVKHLGLSLPGCYMIAFNGAVLYDCSADRVLYSKSIPVQDVYQLFLKAKEEDIYIQTYSKQGILAEKKGPELSFYQEISKLSSKIVTDIRVGLTEEPHKVMLIDLENPNRLNDFYEKNKSWTSERVGQVFSSKHFLEYVPFGINKGIGVEYFCKLLNIPIANTVAIGNEKNDIDLLKKAKIGAAVKNAVDELKQLADYITSADNNHDAVAEVIETFILN